MRKINNYTYCWFVGIALVQITFVIWWRLQSMIAMAMASMKCNDHIFSISRQWLLFLSQSCVNWLALAWPVMAGLGFFTIDIPRPLSFAFISIFFSFSLVYFCLNWNSSSPRHSAHSAFGTCVNIINNVQFPHWVTIKSSLSFMDFWQSKWNNNCWISFLRLETIIIRMLQSHRVYIGKSGLRTVDCKRNTHRRLEIIIIRLNESRKWY